MHVHLNHKTHVRFHLYSLSAPSIHGYARYDGWPIISGGVGGEAFGASCPRSPYLSQVQSLQTHVHFFHALGPGLGSFAHHAPLAGFL